MRGSVLARGTTLWLTTLVLVAACDQPIERTLSTAPLTPPGTPLFAITAAAPTEGDALAISATIQQRHLPYLVIADPHFASADPASTDYNTIVGYDHAGDGAIWTGHYLAAEAFRYGVTSSPNALRNVRRALRGLKGLVDVTGTSTVPDELARFYVPQTSPYAQQITTSESRHGIYTGTVNGEAMYWIDNVSRDQYSGVFFGLAVAYDLVPDETVRTHISRLVTRMLTFLIRNGWNVPRPDGSYSTTFLQRPDQQLTLLQIGRHVNPARFAAVYAAARASLGATVALPIRAECSDTYGSYFKFNLDYINLYNLIRLEEPASPFLVSYRAAYDVLRGCTGGDQNAHFDMIDRALRGTNTARDAEAQELLGEWLQRPRRDPYVDVRDKYAACGENRACAPVPVPDRPTTDFLWQRSPLLLYGGGDGTVEEAGIDYILPYWMGRYYGVL
jgi:hypothetical protein